MTPALRVLRGEHLAERLALDRQAVRRRRRADRALDPAQGDRRLAGEPHRVVARLLARARSGSTRKWTIPSARACSGESCSPFMISSVARPGPTSAGQPLRPACAGEQAEPHLRQADQRALGPRAKRKSQASATSRPPPSAWPLIATTVGCGSSAKRVKHLLREISARSTPSVVDPLELGDVGAGHEDALERAADEHRADVSRRRSSSCGRRGELGDDLLVDRVQRRAVEREDGDRSPSPLEADDLSHRRAAGTPRSRAAGSRRCPRRSGRPSRRGATSRPGGRA